MSADNEPIIKGAEPADSTDATTFPTWEEIWDHCGIPRNDTLSPTQLAGAIEAHPDTGIKSKGPARELAQRAARDDELAVRKDRVYNPHTDSYAMFVTGYELLGGTDGR